MTRVDKDAIAGLLKGRTVLVTGGDGFVGSHLVETLLGYDANVHVLVRPTSSGMLHNTGHVQRKATIHRADLTDKQAILQTLKVLKSFGDQAVIFHLGAQAHVGECWNRPYETLSANVLGVMNLLQSIVDLDMDVYRVDTAGSSEEYGNVREEMRDQYRFDTNGGLILDERLAGESPERLRDREARGRLPHPQLPRRLRGADRRDADVQQLRAAPEPAVHHADHHHPGPDARRDHPGLRAVAARLLLRQGRGARPHLRRALRHPGRRLRVRLRVDDLDPRLVPAHHPDRPGARRTGAPRSSRPTRRGGRASARARSRSSRVDFSKFNQLTGWTPEYSWEDGVRETIKWYAEHRERWATRIDW